MIELSEMWNRASLFIGFIRYKEQYTFMKRFVKRSMFIQIMLFSMSGIRPF